MSPSYENTQRQEMANEGAAAWFARWRQGDMSETEFAALETWLANAVENREAFERVAEIWDEVEEVRRNPAIMSAREEAVNSVRRARRARLARGWAAAATAVAVLGVVGGHFLFGGSGTPAMYSTNVGERSVVNLADGSIVTLDTDSAVQVWPRGSERRLKLLRGRAYFQVAKDATHPFVVATSRGSVTAVGTAFDVRDDARGVKIVLVEGKVRIQPGKADPKPVMMTAGFEYLQDASSWRTRKADTNETSWVNGTLVFQEQPLSAIVDELNRYATDKIVIDDPEVGARRLSAVLQVGDVESFLNSVEVLKLASVQRTAARQVRLTAN